MTGGIVGYNRGSVFNSFVKSTKLTFNIQNNASNRTTNIDQFKEDYSWGFEAGLIVGYHDPGGKADAGWAMTTTDILNDYEHMENATKQMLTRDLISYRIQSCYAQNSVISAVGRIYMDDENSWGNADRYGNESMKCAISMGGIAGGSSANGNAEFAINACFAKGNVFIYDATATGSSSHGTGWDTEKIHMGWQGISGGGNRYDYYARAKRPYHQVQLSVAAINAGINHDNDANNAFWCLASNGTAHYTQSDDAVNDDNRLWEKVNIDAKDYPSGDTIRYTRYNAAKSGNVGSDMPETSGGSVNNTVSQKYAFKPIMGFVTYIVGVPTDEVAFVSMFGKVIKTDVNTGLLTYYANGSVLRKGATLSAAKTNGNLAYEFMINGEPWALYFNELTRPDGGEEKSPSTATFCVRGQ